MTVRCAIELYNSSFVLQESIEGQIATAFSGYSSGLQTDNCVAPFYFPVDNINMGITIRIGHCATARLPDRKSWGGVPIAYPLAISAQGAFTNFTKTGGAGDYTVWNERNPVNAIGTDYVVATASTDKESAKVQSAASASLPSSGANSVLAALRVDGVMTPQSASKTATDIGFYDATLAAVGNKKANAVSGATVEIRYLTNDGLPIIQRFKPGLGLTPYTRADLDGTALQVYLAQTASNLTRFDSGWMEALMVDSFDPTINVLAFSAMGLDGSGFLCGVTPLSSGLANAADLSGITGDTNFLIGNTCLSANLNKANPKCQFTLGGSFNTFNTGGYFARDIWCAIVPSGTPSLEGTIIRQVASGNAHVVNCNLNTSRQISLKDGSTLLAAGSYTLPTTAVTYIRLHVFDVSTARIVQLNQAVKRASVY